MPFGEVTFVPSSIMKKSPFLLLILALSFGFWLRQDLDTRFQTGHSDWVYQRFRDYKSGYQSDEHKKAYDRPDEAEYFDFIRRVSPVTHTIPHGAAFTAYQQVLTMQSTQKTTGTTLTWVERGPDNVGGRTRTVMFDPNDATGKMMFAAGVGGGVWKTNDITAVPVNWVNVNPMFSNIAVTFLAYDPTDTQVMYFGTGEGWGNLDAQQGAGIWKSTDGGATFAWLPSTSGANFRYNNKLVVTSDGVLYAATNSGLFRSQDKGLSFVKVLGSGAGAGANGITDLELKANGDLIAGVKTSGIFISSSTLGSSQGTLGTWTKSVTTSVFPNGFGRIELAAAPSNASYVYALIELGYKLDKVYRSTDGGVTWAPTATEPSDPDGGIPDDDFTRGQAWYDLTIAVHPLNHLIVYAGGIDLFKSVDGGNGWDMISHWYGGFGEPYVHADQHGIIFRPGYPDYVVFANDGGVHVTTDGGQTFTDKNNGYNVTQFYSVSPGPGVGNPQILGGAQDNGSNLISTPGIGSAVEVTGGDGAFVAFHKTNADTMFTSYVYENLYRSRDGGLNFDDISNPSLGSGNTYFINPFEYDPNNPNALYQASTGIWRHNNATSGSGSGWVRATPPTSSPITALGFSKTPAHVMYYAGGQIFRMANCNTSTAGSTPQVLNSSGGPLGYVTCISVNPYNANHIIVTTSSLTTQHVFETRNADMGSACTWRNLMGNLPDVPVNWAVFEPNNINGVLIATDLGVFRCANITATHPVWTSEATGLGFPRVDMIRVRETDNSIHIGTHGRGFFSCYSYSQKPEAAFGPENGSELCGGSVHFIDSTKNVPLSWFWTFGDGTTSTLQNPSHTYAAPGTYTVRLITGNSMGSDTLTRTFSFTFRPGVTAFAGADASVCSGQPFNLLATGGDFYSWSPATGLSNPNIPNPVLTTYINRTYIVTVRDSAGCEDKDTINITVNPVPGIWAGSDVTIALGDSVQLSPSGGLYYEWTPATGLSCTTCTNPWAKPTTNTAYTVKGFNSSGCSSTDAMLVRVVPPVGIDDPLAGFESVVYPNPASEVASVTIRTPAAGELTVRVYGLQGSLVFDHLLQHPGGEYAMDIPVSGLPVGQYTILLGFAGHQLVKRIQVIH